MRRFTIALGMALVLGSGLYTAQTARAHSDEWWEQQVERQSLSGISEEDLRNFNNFLHTHRRTARLLQQDPDLINSRHFLRDHPALRDWLDDHPETAQAARTDPSGFLAQAQASRQYATWPISPEDLRSFERYLDTHWAVADDLRRDPDLVSDSYYLRSHPSLQVWFEDHPDAAATIRQRPQEFVRRDRNLSIQDFLAQLFR
ncbi:MAG TPA: hypothetical protein VKJ47_03740 [Candidatus Binatia bacterium]|nr:hypothetical protein [Candidatus Binatia bacterium]